MRGEPPVHHTVLVRVGHGLCHLPEQRELIFERNPAGLVRLPQVKSLEPVVHRIGQANAQVVFNNVRGAQQPFVRQPGHDPELVLGDPPHLRPLGRGCPG